MEIKLSKCDNCGKDIPYENFTLAQYLRKRFCSKECSDKFHNPSVNELRVRIIKNEQIEKEQ